MKKLLRIDSSVRANDSISSELTDVFCEKWVMQNGSNITKRHVGMYPPNHPSHQYTIANYTPPDARNNEMEKALEESNILVQELFDHEEYVFAIPMYNFSIPSTLKAYIDNVVRVGMTFNINEKGEFQGGLKDKKMTVISSRGAAYSSPSPLEQFDLLTPYISTVMGFMGVSDITFVVAENLDFAGSDVKEAQISKAKKTINQLFS